MLLHKARAAIGDWTPLCQDCGALCNRACCMPDEDGDGGMFLFPGEEALIPAGFRIYREEGLFAPIAMCGGTCDRDARPLACRIFPLTPVYQNGVWKVRMDARARSLCPLARSGVRGLQPEFARAVTRAMRIIAADPAGEAFLHGWQAVEEPFRAFRL
ncbi:MAG: hypothetical protein ACOYI5_05605 [Christensenellales bacterium]|jgi:hypothetical protein